MVMSLSPTTLASELPEDYYVETQEDIKVEPRDGLSLKCKAARTIAKRSFAYSSLYDCF
jgi:hypothetical protein